MGRLSGISCLLEAFKRSMRLGRRSYLAKRCSQREDAKILKGTHFKEVTRVRMKGRGEMRLGRKAGPLRKELGTLLPFNQ